MQIAYNAPSAGIMQENRPFEEMPESNPPQSGCDPFLRLEPGSTFAEQFIIAEVLGHGGMSTVYKAEDTILCRPVALKILDPLLVDSRAVERFRIEAKATTRLDHPNICKIYRFGVHAGQPYMAMELVAGVTLADYLADVGRLDCDQIKTIFLPLFSALSYAHENDIIHRDIKPRNVMITRSGEDTADFLQPVLVDFGMAKLQDQSATMTNVPVGTPLYMSPEQCSGAVTDHRSDIYSLACVIYECLSGKPPFAGGTAYETMYDHLTRSVPDFDELSGPIRVPRCVALVVLKALKKKPEQRQQTIAQFKDEFINAWNISTNSLPARSRRASKSGWLIPLSVSLVASSAAIWHLRNHVQTLPDLLPRAEERRLTKFKQVSGSKTLLNAAHDIQFECRGLCESDPQKCRQRKLDAAAMLEQALQIESKSAHPDPFIIYKAQFDLGHISLEFQQYDRAMQLFRKAYEVYPVPGTPGHYYKFQVLEKFSYCYECQGKYDLAIAELKKAIVDFRGVFPSSDQVTTAFRSLARLYEQTGKDEAALGTYREAFGIIVACKSLETNEDVAPLMVGILSLENKLHPAKTDAVMKEIYSTVEELAENGTSACSDLAEVCLHLNRVDDAARLLKMADSKSASMGGDLEFRRYTRGHVQALKAKLAARLKLRQTRKNN